MLTELTQLKKKLFKYILTLNFLNQASITGFHLGFLKTWLHWNNNTSIDNFVVDVIIQRASTFVNLKLHSLTEIDFSKIINYSLFFNNAWKENKLTLSGRTSTGQHTS